MAFETSRLTVTSVTFVTQVQYDLASQINCAFAAFDLAKHLRVDQIGLVELEICCRTARIEPITKKTHTHTNTTSHVFNSFQRPVCPRLSLLRHSSSCESWQRSFRSHWTGLHWSCQRANLCQHCQQDTLPNFLLPQIWGFRSLLYILQIFNLRKLVFLYSFKLSPDYSWLVSLIFLGLFGGYWSLPTKSTEKIRRTEGEYLVYDATLTDITVTALVPSKRRRAPKIRKSSNIFVWSWGPLAWNRTREYRRRVWESEMIVVGGWYGMIW